jgi:FAD/FMN-containing dehydrogenase
MLTGAPPDPKPQPTTPTAPSTDVAARGDAALAETGRLRPVMGWGGIRRESRERLDDDLVRATEGATLSRGLGRSYGDSSLPARDGEVVVTTTFADRLLGLDPASGVLRAEAGVSLLTLNRTLLPRGLFVPVTPGTQYVTLGGMVASDVHGKEHHVRGCIGEHVRSLRMRLASGEIATCSPDHETELFDATLGGMGLTGHILEVELSMLRVPSPWIRFHSRRVPDIDAFLEALREGAARWPYTVGWIDCLTRGKHMGRGILMAGDWASAAEAPRRYPSPHLRIDMPFTFPDGLLGRPAVAAFNEAYYRKHPARPVDRIVHWETFFYPLDFVGEWRRMYGRRGFTQYQCVIPEAAGHAAVRGLMELLSRSGGASFLCVIKDCGPEGRGVLSFPMRGTSVALDIPIRAGTQELIDELNRYVIGVGGRIYLTKDQFTRREHFEAMEPRLPRFRELRRRYDPERRIRSAQSARLID